MMILFWTATVRSSLAFSTTARHVATTRTTKNTVRPFVATRLFASTKAGGGGGRVSSAVQDKDTLSKTDTSSSNKKKKVEKLDTQPPRGTRDFFPADMRLRTWLFDQWRSVAASYGFSEYDAPVLESESLYTRKAGEEVTQQLYNFKDKGDRRVALRPEMTPSLARMVLLAKPIMPIKWFSIPQCWRYERMTRGRRREHYQWNMDIWGITGVEAEAELLSAMVQFFKNVGLTSNDVGIKVNSRLVIGEVLSELGIPEEKFAATCVLVDKLEKVPIDAIQGELEELGLTKAVVEQLLETLTNNSIEALSDVLGKESKAVQQLQQLFDLCDAYGISDWILLDASVVRGLAYYTGVVFEAFDRKGELRAIAGGGRYDKLLETFGGDPTPAAGFGFGDAVIIELLKERNVLPTLLDKQNIDTVVFAMDSEYYNACLSVAGILREAGQKVDVVLEQRKSKWVFKHANRLGANYVAVVGSNEFENKEVSIKDMQQSKQETIKMDDLKEWVATTTTTEVASAKDDDGGDA